MTAMWMVQRGERPGFALEARDPFPIRGERVRQDLDRDFAIELRVACPIDFADSACPERRHNLIRAELRSGSEAHASVVSEVERPAPMASTLP